ncbi:hypothetical protein ACQ4WX_32990 [Streptomyces lasalocidi]
MRRGSLRAQIEDTVTAHDPARYKELAEQTSSAPGESAALLRRLFYGLMDLPEPEGHPALLDPLPLPPYLPARRTAPVRVLAGGIGTDPPEVGVVRYSVVGGGPDPSEAPDLRCDSAHTVVDEETRETGRLRVADIVVRYAAEDDPRLGPRGRLDGGGARPLPVLRTGRLRRRTGPLRCPHPRGRPRTADRRRRPRRPGRPVRSRRLRLRAPRLAHQRPGPGRGRTRDHRPHGRDGTPRRGAAPRPWNTVSLGLRHRAVRRTHTQAVSSARRVRTRVRPRRSSLVS